MKPLVDCHLYTFVDTAFLRGRSPVDVAQQLCDGGSDIIQLRAKQSTVDEVRRLADAILPITRAAGVALVVNDHLELAREAGAEMCHLGQEDFFDAGYQQVSELRIADTDRGRVLAMNRSCGLRIGLSTHAPGQCERAVAAGADYVAIGPVYATGTKPTAKPVTLDYVRWAANNVALPWFAIGGINLDTLDDVLAAGARRVCVVSAILNAPDIAEECAKFRARMNA